jgi:hypothetical protein
MAATEGWRTERVGRWCSRFLVVLGGAVAGTATAWALSTSGASAATEPADDPIANIVAEVRTHTAESTEKAGKASAAERTSDTSATSDDASATSADDATTSSADATTSSADATTSSDSGSTACAALGVAQDRREVRSISGSTGDINEADADVTSAICDFADRAAIQPARRALGAAEQVMRNPQDTRQVIERTLTPSQDAQDFTKTVLGLLNPKAGGDLIENLPEIPGLPGERFGQPALPAPDTAAPGRAASGPGFLQIFTVEIPMAAQNVSGSAAPVRHSTGDSADDARSTGDDREDAPVQPLRIPLAPPTVPSAPGGTNGAGHVDGTMFGVPVDSFAAFDDTVIGEVRSGVRHLQVSPGTQPGVTPD